MDVFQHAQNIQKNKGVRKQHGNLQKYATQNPLQKALLKRHIHAICEMISSVSPHSILDMGGGEGFLASVYSDHCSSSITIIDTDDEALQHGKKLFPHVRFIHGDIQQPSPSRNLYDLVLCIQVLEHLNEPLNALENLKSYSTRYCLLSVPHEPFFRIMNFMRMKNMLHLGDDPEHLQNWTMSSFSRFLKKANLKIIRKKSTIPWMTFLCEKT